MHKVVEIGRVDVSGDCAVPLLDRVGDYLLHYCARHPGRDAAVLGDFHLTYGELSARVDRCARALLANGVSRGDRVAVLTTPRPEYLMLFLAMARIGVIWVGLNPRHRIREFRYVLEDAKPTLALGLARFEQRDFVAELQEVMRGSTAPRHFVPFDALDEFLVEGESVPNRAIESAVGAVRGADPLCIVYTSGTTGASKGAVLTHRAFVLSYAMQFSHWPVRSLRILSTLPLSHIGGLGDIGTYCLVGGGTQIMMERFDAGGALGLTRREHVSVWYLMVAQFQKIAALPEFDEVDLPSLELAIWGDGPMPVSLISRLRAKAGRVTTSYGLSEACGPLTYPDPDANLDTLSRTVGKPAPHCEIRLADGSGQPVEPGEVGEIQIRGEVVMQGYFGRPDATAEAIDPEGWLHSGDLAVALPDGNLELVGRSKEMFKSGGYNIYPREIELVLQSHPGVDMAAVVAVPDPVYREVGHAFVLRRPDINVDETAIERHCRGELANYKVPKRFYIREALPMLPNGKIDKAALREEAKNLFPQLS
jgi:acyl-CoA synthetase (AMP-forming)/AMP-acid ligase II